MGASYRTYNTLGELVGNGSAWSIPFRGCHSLGHIFQAITEPGAFPPGDVTAWSIPSRERQSLELSLQRTSQPGAIFQGT